jgi:hypothetical protein
LACLWSLLEIEGFAPSTISENTVFFNLFFRLAPARADPQGHIIGFKGHIGPFKGLSAFFY